MSQLTLSNVVTFVQIHIPDLPQVKIGTHLNLVLEEIYERLKQVNYSTFSTRAPTTSGTINVTNNSASVSFSGTPMATSDGLRHIQIANTGAWYGLTRLTDSTGTLSSVYAGATNATETYKIVYPTVTLPAAVGYVLSVRREGWGDLEPAPNGDIASILAENTTGCPRWWAPYTFDGNASPDDAVRLYLKPFPDALYTLGYQSFQRPTLIDPSTVTPTTEKVPVPTSFRQAILYGTLALCWMAEDQDQANPWEGKADRALRQALAATSSSPSGQRRGVFDKGPNFYALQNAPEE